MLSKKKIADYERANARVARSILRNRAARPRGLILWAEAFERRQAAEQAAREAEAQGGRD